MNKFELRIMVARPPQKKQNVVLLMNIFLRTTCLLAYTRHTHCLAAACAHRDPVGVGVAGRRWRRHGSSRLGGRHGGARRCRRLELPGVGYPQVPVARARGTANIPCHPPPPSPVPRPHVKRAQMWRLLCLGHVRIRSERSCNSKGRRV